jgi:hypothetical protein
MTPAAAVAIIVIDTLIWALRIQPQRKAPHRGQRTATAKIWGQSPMEGWEPFAGAGESGAGAARG